MKRFLVLFLILIMSFTLVLATGCDKPNGDGNDSPPIELPDQEF